MIRILRAKRTWLTILASLFFVGVVVWAVSYHAWEFKGGLSISDSGFFSYPRYYAQIGSLPLWKAGEYQFTVRGLPPGPLELVLAIQEATEADRALLTSLSTAVNVTITDSSGNKICEASGSLSISSADPWILPSHSAYFWHPRCTHIQTSRFRTYIVKVTVSDVDTRSPRWTIVPALRGGGIELP